MTCEPGHEHPISVGDKVPDFEIPVYDPTKDDFDTFKLSENMSKNRWTCLFFYPADFTFV
jgi:peroxiredoxin (alkyl hydroperoxide reductase subunit C)